MTRLSPHVLETIRSAHDSVRRDLDEAHTARRRQEQNLRQTLDHIERAEDRLREYAATLDAHRDAIAREEAGKATRGAYRCPACGVTGGAHTGGCAIIASGPSIGGITVSPGILINTTAGQRDVDQAREDLQRLEALQQTSRTRDV